jgi:hypothetical protein
MVHHMKYVVFKRQHRMTKSVDYVPLSFIEAITHSSVQLRSDDHRYVPDSAGFWYRDPEDDRVLLGKHGSESLRLGPRAGRDELLLQRYVVDGLPFPDSPPVTPEMARELNLPDDVMRALFPKPPNE